MKFLKKLQAESDNQKKAITGHKPEKFNGLCPVLKFKATFQNTGGKAVANHPFSVYETGKKPYFMRVSRQQVSIWLGSPTSNLFKTHCTREWWNTYFRLKMGMSNRYKC